MSTFPGMTDERRNTSESDEFLSIGEVAKAFGVTVATVRNWDRDGRIVSTRTLGGQRRFKRSDVAALLEAAS
jgi:excisionase family DNA binding protein